MVRSLGVSRQAASQLIDSLVLRGYLTREINPSDRRRMDIELTTRGHAAADAVAAAITKVDNRLMKSCTGSQLAGLRAGLTVLAAIKQELSNDNGSRDD
jgi:DNA-binding MarR family transcriptional regulator